MHMAKKLFGAPFEQSKKIQGGYKKYVKNAYKKMGIVNVIVTSLLAIVFFGIFFYALGVGMLEGMISAKTDEINILNYHNTILAASFAAPFTVVSKFVIFLWIFIWVTLIVRRLLPRWTVVSFCTIGWELGVVMSLLQFFTLGPILFGYALVGVGWIGILLQIFFLIIFGIRQIKNELVEIYRKLYNQSEEKNSETEKRYFNRNLIFLILSVMVINMFTFRFGCISQYFELWSLVYSWLFLLLGLFTIYIVKVLVIRNGISIYYFRKYKELYKETWNLTDKQWYGKRRAKNLLKRN